MELERRKKLIEKKIEQPIVIKGVRGLDERIKGRIVQRNGYVLLEYNESIAGFFWHFETIEKLLKLIEEGRRSVVLTIEGCRDS